MSDESRAKDAIGKLAKRKVEENIDPNQKKKYAKKLKDLALDHKEMLFGAKMLHDLGKGKLDYDINDNVGVEADTKKKSIKLKYNKKF
jgi:hypothetical protein